MAVIKTEVELCERVVAWLKVQHWDVYQEVSLGYGSRRADIVAVMGPTVWIVEAKLGASIALIDQALAWRGYAHLISIVTRKYKRPPRNALHWICKNSGIGWISIDEKDGDVRIEYRPRFVRDARMVDHLRGKLNDRQKNAAAAGSQAGGYWTPFSETCREVLSRVREKPGITMKELMDGLKHHYSTDASARSCLALNAREGLVKGVRVEREGRMIRFYPKEAELEE